MRYLSVWHNNREAVENYPMNRWLQPGPQPDGIHINVRGLRRE